MCAEEGSEVLLDSEELIYIGEAGGFCRSFVEFHRFIWRRLVE